MSQIGKIDIVEGLVLRWLNWEKKIDWVASIKTRDTAFLYRLIDEGKELRRDIEMMLMNRDHLVFRALFTQTDKTLKELTLI